MEALSKLFGSEIKVKIMRLFLANPEHVFTVKDIATRVKTDSSKVRREMGNIEKMGLVRHRQKNNKQGFIVDPQFTYLEPLRNFLINLEPFQSKALMKKVGRLGNIKLVIVAGVFIQDPESRADLLIVGDSVKKGALENTVKTIESEMGRELRYAYFTTDDFKYRLSMFDKLIRDILDYPHKKVVNRLGIL